MLKITTYAYLPYQTTVTSPDPGGALAPSVTSIYDAAGDLLSQTDALSQQTVYTYDHLHRLHSVAQPNGDTTTYGYDANGNRTSIADSAGNTTTFVFDNLNRLTTETNQLGQSRSYTYDDNGNRLKATDRDGRTRSFEYDHLNRETAEKWHDTTTYATIVYTDSMAYYDDGTLHTNSDVSE